MKNISLLLAFLCVNLAHTQTVGVNTSTPRALLEIPATNSSLPSAEDGLLPVRVATFPSSNPTSNQNGLWTYHTANRQNYWWDETTGGFESFRNTLDQAYDNNGFGQGRSVFADSGALTVVGDGLFVTGTFGNGNNLNLENGGNTNLIFFPKTGSLIKGNMVSNTNTTDYDYNVIFGDGYNSDQYGASYATIFGYYTSASADYSICLGYSYSLSFGGIAIGASGISLGGSLGLAIGNSYTVWDGIFAIGQNTGDHTDLSVIGNNNHAVSTGVNGYFTGIGNNNTGNFTGSPYSRQRFIGFNNTFGNGLGMAIGNDNTPENGLTIGHHLVSNSRQQISIGFYNTSYTPDPESSFGQEPDNRLLVFGNGTATQPSDAFTVLEDGRTGVGTAYPEVKLQVAGGFSSQPESFTVTSNQQTINVENKSYIRVNSNNLPSNREIVLSDGNTYGQILTIECNANGSFGIRLVDGSNSILSNASIDLYHDDTITLIFRNSWYQIGHSNN